MTTTADNNKSTFVYACFRAMQALERVKSRDDDIHDGCGEDEVVSELYEVLDEALVHFDKTYLDAGTMWHDGVYDYDVWDADDEHAKLFYELLVLRAMANALGAHAKFEVGDVESIVDAYAASNGWKPGKGGE